MNTGTIRTRMGNLGAVLFAAAALLAPSLARAEEPVAKGTASYALASRYVWRGQTLTKGLALQPTVGVTYGGFSTNLWANVDLDRKEAEGDTDNLSLTETDVTLAYTLPVGPVSATAGYIYYGFDGASDTQELYLTVAVAALLNPTLSLYYDIDEGDGAFAVLGVSHALPLTDKIALTAGALVGFNLEDKAMGLDADGKKFTGPYYGEVSLATSIPLFGAVSLDPRIAYAFGLGDGKDAIGSVSIDGKRSMLYGSVAATVAF